MVDNVLNLIEELQQLLDYKIVGTKQISRVESLIRDAIEVISVIPTGGISNFETFKDIWLKCGYTKYTDDELANYVKAIALMNECTIRVVVERKRNTDLFDMDNDTTYTLGNLSDAFITKDQAELLEKVGIDVIECLEGTADD